MRIKTRKGASSRPGNKSEWKLDRSKKFGLPSVTSEYRAALQRGSEGRGLKR